MRGVGVMGCLMNLHDLRLRLSRLRLAEDPSPRLAAAVELPKRTVAVETASLLIIEVYSTVLITTVG